MKTKKTTQKLRLSKTTITNLTQKGMKKLKGGACTYPITGCTYHNMCCTNDIGENIGTCPSYMTCAPE